MNKTNHNNSNSNNNNNNNNNKNKIIITITIINKKKLPSSTQNYTQEDRVSLLTPVHRELYPEVQRVPATLEQNDAGVADLLTNIDKDIDSQINRGIDSQIIIGTQAPL